jgi:hypothetical protein
MLETLHLLCQIFAKDTVTVQEAAHVVGSGKTTTGVGRPIVIEQRASAYQRIEIGRIGNSDIATHVTLTLARGRVLMLGQLRAVYGDYQALPRTGYLSNQRVVFHVKPPGMIHTSLIIADVDSERISDDSRVTTVSVRRDRVVE